MDLPKLVECWWLKCSELARVYTDMVVLSFSVMFGSLRPNLWQIVKRRKNSRLNFSCLNWEFRFEGEKLGAQDLTTYIVDSIDERVVATVAHGQPIEAEPDDVNEAIPVIAKWWKFHINPQAKKNLLINTGPRDL